MMRLRICLERKSLRENTACIDVCKVSYLVTLFFFFKHTPLVVYILRS
jgi:hypothetical protein